MGDAGFDAGETGPSPHADDDGGVGPVGPCNADTWRLLKPHLRGCDLRGADLQHENLGGVNLKQAMLVGARLTGADLTGANLHSADLSSTYMAGVQLSFANLYNAILSHSYFDPSSAHGAKLYWLQQCPSDLSGVPPQPEHSPPGLPCLQTPRAGSLIVAEDGDLSGADLTGVDLDALWRPRLYGLKACPNLPTEGAKADEYACLAQPNGRFTVVGPGLSLEGADLSGLDLTGMVLRDTRTHDLVCPAATPGPSWVCRELPARSSAAILGPGVNLVYSNLDGADLGGVDLTDASLRGAVDLAACPDLLPRRWKCVEQGDGLHKLMWVR